MISAAPLLSVRDLTVSYRLQGTAKGTFAALNEVSLEVLAGEILGVVGESGSGKSTLGRATLGLVAPQSGQVEVKPAETPFVLTPQNVQRWRGHAQMVFQDPMSSFNPRRSLRSTIAEPLTHVVKMDRSEAHEKIDELFERMGLKAELADRRPNGLSGGQLQRASIARALSLDPAYIVCDEPTSALDASVRGGVVDLLREIRETFGVAYLFVSHDLGVINAIADRVIVLHRGVVVESGPTEQVLMDPQHAYTRKLRSAVPQLVR